MLIYFDFLRAEDNRVDCFPCIKVSSSSVETSEGIYIGMLTYCICVSVLKLHCLSSAALICLF